MKTKLITGLLATALIAAPMAPALAHDTHPARHAPHNSYRGGSRHDGNNAALGIFAGLAALTTFAIIANANQPPPRPVHYVAPRPVYYYAQPQRRVVYTYPTSHRVTPAPTYHHGSYYR